MPFPGTDTFVWERWRPLDESTAREQASNVRLRGEHPEVRAKVQTLIDLLFGLQPPRPRCGLMHQPRYPLESTLGGGRRRERDP